MNGGGFRIFIINDGIIDGIIKNNKRRISKSELLWESVSIVFLSFFFFSLISMLEFKVYINDICYLKIRGNRRNIVSKMLEFLLGVRSWKYISSEYFKNYFDDKNAIILANIDLQFAIIYEEK